LHFVLQIGFDWTDFHLHRLRIRKKDYGVPRLGGLACTHDAREVKLADLHFRINERFLPRKSARCESLLSLAMVAFAGSKNASCAILAWVQVLMWPPTRSPGKSHCLGFSTGHQLRRIWSSFGESMQRVGVDHPFGIGYRHRHAALRDDLQVSTRRAALLARCYSHELYTSRVKEKRL
jgi:hypothetical protein